MFIIIQSVCMIQCISNKNESNNVNRDLRLFTNSRKSTNSRKLFTNSKKVLNIFYQFILIWE